jgi:guanine deaminase
MATLGGGEFFAGQGSRGPGSFGEGYDFDALVIDDGALAAPFNLSIRERLERLVYLPEECRILEKYVKGRELLGTG